MQKYKYIVPFTIIFRNSEFLINKLLLSSHFSYFEDIEEDTIDVSNISIPKEMKDPEKVFKKFIDYFVLKDNKIDLSFECEIGWFVCYFGYKTKIGI